MSSWLEDLVPGPVVRRSSSYAVPACNGQIVIVDALGAGITITLPAVPVVGQIVVVKHAAEDAYSVSIDGNGKMIDGLSFRTLTGAYACAWLCFNGSTWSILGTFVVLPS